MQRYGKKDVSKYFQFVYLKYCYEVLTPLIQCLSAAQFYVENRVKECLRGQEKTLLTDQLQISHLKYVW